MDEKGAFTLYADESEKGKRLDAFISSRLSTLSRSYISTLITGGNIRVCGQFKKPGYRVKKGDRIRGEIPPQTPSPFLPEPMDLDIIFEDQHIIVINKTPGLVVHPAPGHQSGTLVNGLLYHFPDLKGIGGKIRPGIVHRLDKDTSGVIIVAKDAVTHQHLARQFKSRNVGKEYIALVYGDLDSETGKISLPIWRHPVDRKKMSTINPKGRSAETFWKIRERFMGVSLVDVTLKTGRTHQIRVHFAAINHPVIGDPVYATRSALKRFPKDLLDPLKSVHRQMLHAHRLTLMHPATEKTISFESALPQDMTGLIKALTALSAMSHD